MSLIIRALRLLDGHYGDLKWWPGKTPFEVIVGAILTQNTAWINVEKAIRALKSARLLSLKGMRRAPLAVIARCVRPSGYYNQKALKLKGFIEFVDREYGGSLSRMRHEKTPALREKLLDVRGVGPETADSMLCYALNRPVFVVDAYTRRIFGRLGALRSGEDYEEIRNLFESSIISYIIEKRGGRRGVPGRRLLRILNQFHACIVMAGKDFCHKNSPDCASCPLHGLKRCRVDQVNG